MAAQEDVVTKDMEKARSTYERFMGSLKWSIPILFLIAMGVVVLIAP